MQNSVLCLVLNAALWVVNQARATLALLVKRPARGSRHKIVREPLDAFTGLGNVNTVFPIGLGKPW